MGLEHASRKSFDFGLRLPQLPMPAYPKWLAAGSAACYPLLDDGRGTRDESERERELSVVINEITF